MALAVHAALQRAGIDPQSVLSPVDAQSLAVVKEAPDFIQSAAGYLSLAQQRWLTEVDASQSDNQATILEAKRRVCAETAQQGSCTDNELRQIYAREIRHLRVDSQQGRQDDGALLETLIARLVEKLADDDFPQHSVERLLRQRFELIPWPECRLLASLVLHTTAPDHALDQWLAEASEEGSGEQDSAGS